MLLILCCYITCIYFALKEEMMFCFTIFTEKNWKNFQEKLYVLEIFVKIFSGTTWIAILRSSPLILVYLILFLVTCSILGEILIVS